MAKSYTLGEKSVRRLANIVRAVEASQGMPGLKRRGRSAPRTLTQFGVIVEEGPAGEPDWPDDRYWVKLGVCGNSNPNPTHAATIVPVDEDSPFFETILVTNLSEWQIKGHLLQIDQPVEVQFLYDKSNPTVCRAVMHEPTEHGVWVKIISATPTDNPAVNRWVYIGVEQVRSGNNWEDKEDGRTFEGLVNSIEGFNNAIGIEGNSVDLANLPSTMPLQPVRGTPVVFIRPAPRLGTGVTWVFQYENAVDGPCPPNP